MTKSNLLTSALSIAKDLKLDKVTIREIELLDLPEIKHLTPRQIKNLRSNAKLSQAVMARVLNVTPSTYQKWERGEIEPKGANLKLLDIIRHKGVGHVLV